MSKVVEKSGVYRDEKGRGVRFFAGAVVSDEQAAKYGIGADDAEPDEIFSGESANPTDEIESTPDGEAQEGAPEAGADVRDGVVSDGNGGEIAVASAEVAERDAQPVDGAGVVMEERALGPAAENRMQPPAPENRAAAKPSNRRRSHNATTDVELAAEESGEPIVGVADSLDDKDSK